MRERLSSPPDGRGSVLRGAPAACGLPLSGMVAYSAACANGQYGGRFAAEQAAERPQIAPLAAINGLQEIGFHSLAASFRLLADERRKLRTCWARARASFLQPTAHSRQPSTN